MYEINTLIITLKNNIKLKVNLEKKKVSLFIKTENLS